MKVYKSFAKINLSLEVLSKKDDGYHNIDSIMHKIDLYDEMTFSQRSDNKIFINSNKSDLPNGQENLVYKAWQIMSKFKNSAKGLDISIKKNIPIAGGLGGGTSNGILTIKVLNELWGLGFSKTELINLAQPLGADSTFFFYEDLVRVRGIGEKVVDILQIPKYPILLINIGKPLSSGFVYEKLKDYSSGKIEKITNYIHKNKELPDKVFNSLERVSFGIYPELKDIKLELENSGASFALMSGAGPSMFALYSSIDKRDRAYEKFKDKYELVIKSRLV